MKPVQGDECIPGDQHPESSSTGKCSTTKSKVGQGLKNAVQRDPGVKAETGRRRRGVPSAREGRATSGREVRVKTGSGGRKSAKKHAKS